ncbi:MAG: hypothetical protein SGJ10_04535 [Bacteroidota bacterium]|nr:hypothetical protein [Bacteroidota bacterium]
MLLIVICLAGCHRKAKPDLDNPDEPEVCVDLSKYITMSAQFSRDLAKFDPVYPEILYYIKTSYKTIDLDLHRTSNRIMQLFSYNLRTNSFSLILYSRGGQIDTLTGGRQVDFGFKTFTPGPNEWILFQDNSRNIWKVKKDGTAMRKIREKASGPSWNKDGTQILFYDQTTQKNTIMDLDGSTKSVLNIGTSNLSFTGVNGVLVGLNGGSSQIFQYNADYQSKTNTSTADPRSEFSDIGLLPNGYEAIVCQPDWIIKWNLTDSTIKEYLRPNCNSRSYEMPNVSPDGNRVVFTKKCRDKLDAQYLIDKHDIYIMDIRCWRAKKLELP